jgi:hypothetical protein
MNKLTLVEFFPGRRRNGWTHLRSRLRMLALAAACAGLASANAQAGDDDAKTMKSSSTADIAPPALGSRITGLLNLDFSDKYITPRGLDVSKNGGAFQPLVILFVNFYHSDEKKWLTDLTFNFGVWNDIDVGENGADPGNWDEIDGFFGLEAKLFKDWKLDAEETFFKSQTNSYNTSTNFDFKTTYLDHWFGDSGFSINPYGEIFVETTQKATVAFNYQTDNRGFYGVIGADPTYKFKSIPLTLELPTFANICSDSFYQRINGTPGGPGLAVVSTEFKATTPLTFIPISYGAWSAYAGAQFYYLNNPGLLDGNQALQNEPIGGSAHRDRDLVQYHIGLTCFF